MYNNNSPLKNTYLIICLSFLLLLTTAHAKIIPELILAKTYDKSINIKHYLVSEKLDGVRAYWDGEQFLSRQGNRFHAPAWFIENFPKQPLDGELWIARNHFEQTVSTVRKQQPIDQEWQKISYQLFEMPQAKGTFQQRVTAMETLVNTLNIPHLNVIKQYHLPNATALSKKLDDVVAQGAEGLMLHRTDALYHTGRSTDLLKVKKHQDAEARVIQHFSGKGKFKDMLGSMLVENKEGLRFKLGTGFSNQERKNPPAIGALVTYKYFGRTKKGLPRFASFLRIRLEKTTNNE
jgi:DNA ligase-1